MNAHVCPVLMYFLPDQYPVHVIKSVHKIEVLSYSINCPFQVELASFPLGRPTRLGNKANIYTCNIDIMVHEYL